MPNRWDTKLQLSGKSNYQYTIDTLLTLYTTVQTDVKGNISKIDTKYMNNTSSKQREHAPCTSGSSS